MGAKRRLDDLVVARGWAATTGEAARRIMAGEVFEGTRRLIRPGERFSEETGLRLAPIDPWVGRGARKLLAAFEAWPVTVAGRACLDLGSSTGGFTQVLLERGARAVWSVDVGKGLLDARLRADPRVRVLEGTNARDLTPEMLGAAPPSLLVADLAFVSLRAVLPGALRLLVREKDSGAEPEAIVLMKPQFEAELREVARGGVVHNPEVHRRLLEEFLAWEPAGGWRAVAAIESPLRGPAGNKEFLLRFLQSSTPAVAAGEPRST